MSTIDDSKQELSLKFIPEVYNPDRIRLINGSKINVQLSRSFRFR